MDLKTLLIKEELIQYTIEERESRTFVQGDTKDHESVRDKMEIRPLLRWERKAYSISPLQPLNPIL